MKITIVTVCFNADRSIADTLRSVDAQDWPDLEHIVVDGASTDSTMAIIAAHAQPWRLVVSGRDNGIYDAMNKGLALATGDMVGFLNADDMFQGRDAVRSIARFAEAGTDVVYGDLVYVRRDDPKQVLRHWRSNPFRHPDLRLGWMPPHPTFYVSRKLLSQVGEFDTGLRIAGDYDFILRCLSRPTVRAAYVPRVLVRMRSGGVSNASLHSMSRKSREDLLVLRRHGIGGWLTLAAKNIRKLPQFFMSSRKLDSPHFNEKPDR
jgi:glycosyltransferase